MCRLRMRAYTLDVSSAASRNCACHWEKVLRFFGIICIIFYGERKKICKDNILPFFLFLNETFYLSFTRYIRASKTFLENIIGFSSLNAYYTSYEKIAFLGKAVT